MKDCCIHWISKDKGKRERERERGGGGMGSDKDLLADLEAMSHNLEKKFGRKDQQSHCHGRGTLSHPQLKS